MGKRRFHTGAALAALVLLTALAAPGGENKYHHPPGTKGGEMVLVPAGDFGMGCNRKRDKHCDPDENPWHQVTLSAYYIDRLEVTNGQYKECVDATKCRPAKDYTNFNAPDQPAVGVSWTDAAAYCKFAGKALPTEAQWEKAARGADGRVYPWGNSPCGCQCAVQEERQVYGCGQDSTLAVGGRSGGASPYGAEDMSGNVWEWVADWYAADYYKDSPKEDPKGPAEGTARVKRGGGFANVKNYLRASDRNQSSPNTVSNSLGFRCAAKAE